MTNGNQDVAARIRSMVKDAFADPVTAPQMPYSADDLAFFEKIMGNLRQAKA